MAELLSLAAFVILVVLPVSYRLSEVPHRLRDIRAGWKGILFLPVSLPVLIAFAIPAAYLQEYPVLGWGWLGYNIIGKPVSDAAKSAGSGGGGSGFAISPWILIAGFAIMVVAFVIFNYYEERGFRHSWKATGIWAVLHLLMGIELIWVMPIFAVGVVYKVIHDRYGLEVAYVAHLGTNLALLTTALGMLACLMIAG